MTVDGHATIRDVAALAGVSVGTVSRVLAGNQTVKHGLLLRVRAAIEELNYRPNQAARALRSNRVNVVGLLIPDITNPFFAQMANDLERLAADAGYALILSSSHNDQDREARQFMAIMEHKPLGVIFVPTKGRPDVVVPERTRVLAIDRRAEGFASITVNQRESAALALDHLVALGHQRIAYFAGPESTDNARERREGFLARAASLRSAGQPLEVEVFIGDFDFESGEKLARALLNCPPKYRVTAIAAASDQQAIGAIRTARDLGVVVPTDLSVVGFDDITLASLVVPRLTTVLQPVREMAETAFKQITAGTDAMKSEEFMGRLIVRDSTAAAAPHVTSD
ncbi:MAG: LacI family transcriptional regulator [Tabrizicola sp.]|jgi:LacI family transcriptional regulator|nr:LacI family transcriptional regulator [Tabrizicola sp.]